MFECYLQKLVFFLDSILGLLPLRMERYLFLMAALDFQRLVGVLRETLLNIANVY